VNQAYFFLADHRRSHGNTGITTIPTIVVMTNTSPVQTGMITREWLVGRGRSRHRCLTSCDAIDLTLVSMKLSLMRSALPLRGWFLLVRMCSDNDGPLIREILLHRTDDACASITPLLQAH